MKTALKHAYDLLDTMAQQGLIHRDYVKSTNVILRELYEAMKVKVEDVLTTRIIIE